MSVCEKGWAKMPALHLEPRHRTIVEDILRRHVPERAVWAFGSRATGLHLKPFSDLDLAIAGQFKPGERMALLDAFDESLLPIKVDIVELEFVTPDFRQRIEKDLLPLQNGR